MIIATAKCFLITAVLLFAQQGWAQTLPTQSIRIVATPNPNVFPLLLALKRHPELPVTLIAVGDGKGIESAFAEQNADAVAAMTPTIASKVMSGSIPAMHIVAVSLWRGFTAIIVADETVHKLSDLRGKGFILSGPTTGGRGGGPELLFKAALARVGVKQSDIKLCYSPIKIGVQYLLQHTAQTGDPNCDADISTSISGILAVEPAVSGIIMMSHLPFKSKVTSVIKIESIFSGFNSWPSDQLPLGGIGVRIATLEDKSRTEDLARLISKYYEAIDEINNARNNVITLSSISREISDEFEEKFINLNIKLPWIPLMSSLKEGDLRYRNDLSLKDTHHEIKLFLEEILQHNVSEIF